MNITLEQKQLLNQYGIESPGNGVITNNLLLALDDKILEIGFSADYELNQKGRILQQLYDTLYNQMENH